MTDNSLDGWSAAAPPVHGAPALPDAHGHAALLLVESLIHGMRERSMLTVADAVDIVETAADVQVEIADMADGAAPPMRESARLLLAMATSLRQDLRPGDGA